MVFGAAIQCLKHFQNNVSGAMLHKMRLLCRAGDYLSNLDCAALRAITVRERECAIMLFVCGLTLELSLRTSVLILKVCSIEVRVKQSHV